MRLPCRRAARPARAASRAHPRPSLDAGLSNPTNGAITPKCLAAFAAVTPTAGILSLAAISDAIVAEGNAGFVDAVELRPGFAVFEGKAKEPCRVGHVHGGPSIGAVANIRGNPLLRARAMMRATKPCSPAPWTVGRAARSSSEPLAQRSRAPPPRRTTGWDPWACDCRARPRPCPAAGQEPRGDDQRACGAFETRAQGADRPRFRLLEDPEEACDHAAIQRARRTVGRASANSCWTARG